LPSLNSYSVLLLFENLQGHNIEPLTQTTSVDGHSRTREALYNPITWICAFFLFCYVGVEVSLGGWLVTFMLRVRHGGDFESGMVVMGFWLGITIGRVILGFVTGRIGEKLAIAVYLAISVALELCFWLIPNFISSAVFAGFLGFFLGPLFPAAIIVATKILPKRLHVSAIGFAAAFGGGGAALFPFAVGAIAQAKGVQVLQPFALALIAVILLLWCSLPGGFRKGGLEASRQNRIVGHESQSTRMWAERVNRWKTRLGLSERSS
jgi:fucose permease